VVVVVVLFDHWSGLEREYYYACAAKTEFGF
jgi:hypothetical protein